MTTSTTLKLVFSDGRCQDLTGLQSPGDPRMLEATYPADPRSGGPTLGQTVRLVLADHEYTAALEGYALDVGQDGPVFRLSLVSSVNIPTSVRFLDGPTL
jgi:hypothetical protein